jgi:hypothetical protein
MHQAHVYQKKKFFLLTKCLNRITVVFFVTKFEKSNIDFRLIFMFVKVNIVLNL